MKIKITSDSTCDLSPELIKKYDIDILPLYVVMGDDTLKDGIEATPKDGWEFVKWEGAAAMGKNDGETLNREVFWRAMNDVCGKDMRLFEDEFDEFYRAEFTAAKAATRENPCAAKTVALLRERGCRLIVATNPIFPKSATYARLRWAGLEPNDFDYITVYDNCSSSKPNLNYYYDICAVCGIKPEDSIMVGNDVDEDMCAAKLGFDTYLITDCLINRSEKDINRWKHGSFEDFYRLVVSCQ